MDAKNLLNEARSTIENRGMDYGHPSDNMARTARIWSAYLEMPIEDYPEAACMVLVKLARTMEGSKTDNYIDMLGYAAISGMLRTEENELYV